MSAPEPIAAAAGLARCRQIIAAAPDLLAACAAALEWAELNAQRAGTLRVDMLRAAIAKAEGRS